MIIITIFPYLDGKVITASQCKICLVVTTTTVLFKIHPRLESVYFKTNSAERKPYLQDTILLLSLLKERDSTADVCSLKVQPCSGISCQTILNDVTDSLLGQAFKINLF